MAGITPDPGDPYPRPEAPGFLAVDPLFVDDEAPTVRSRPALPVLDDPNRSPNPAVCPFLRRQAGGSLVAPVAFAVDGQTCVAIGSPRGQSQKQQELVCLRTSHVDCPRYQRGAMVAAPAAGAAAGSAAARPRSGPAVPRATLAALLILVLSAGISFGFVVQRGGIAMPVVGASPSPTSVAAVKTDSPAESEEAVPTDEVPPTDEVVPGDSVEPVESVLESEAPSLEPTPEPTPEPTVTPTPEPTVAPTPKPTVKPTTKPTSSRYKLLTACPDQADCWIYKVKSGDNLYSIARYFGHPLKTIYAWNPKYPGASLRVGALIRMPPPTR